MSYYSGEYDEPLLNYLRKITPEFKIQSLSDVEELPANNLLLLFSKLEDDAFWILLQYLKANSKGKPLFEKLMGDHEENNRERVDAFFSRYQGLVLNQETGVELNPLFLYMPKSALNDLTFVLSRQPFFLRQSIQTINDYFAVIFDDPIAFETDQQEMAWNYFWGRILETSKEAH